MTDCTVWPVPPLDIESPESVIDGLRAHLQQSVLRPAIEQ
ncbi:unknown [Haloarcula marismortui ATCC 43049]|uniref:Uncharacterized protein n=2 Tax=Haloarcula marismortui TaxID=2238 RepID=Q5V3N8_HALMA|nr:unknown [Haloarcula marismortui ATCC 43049]